jgi:hypothetical protein
MVKPSEMEYTMSREYPLTELTTPHLWQSRGINTWVRLVQTVPNWLPNWGGWWSNKWEV